MAIVIAKNINDYHMLVYTAFSAEFCSSVQIITNLVSEQVYWGVCKPRNKETRNETKRNETKWSD